MMIDIHRADLYRFGEPKDKTLERLTEIVECGMEEIGYGVFGCRGVVGGLYIEKVWNLSDQEFGDYMKWAKGLISKNERNKL